MTQPGPAQPAPGQPAPPPGAAPTLPATPASPTPPAPVPAPPPGGYAGPADALAAVRSGLAFLAGADAASLPGPVLADCLRDLEAAHSVHIAARSRVLAAFAAQAVYEDDGSRTPAGWLAWQTRATRPAAATAVWWSRRLAAHPRIHDALTDGTVSESYARRIVDWSDGLPEASRQDADKILLAAHKGGADIADLAGLAEEMARRLAPPDEDKDAKDFARRSVHLDLHFQGWGSLAGNLTPEAATTILAGLDSLSKKMGPEDDRTPAQRRHDALEELVRRAIATGDLPDTGGQPTQVVYQMALGQLRSQPGAADLEQAAAAQAAAAGRAAADGQAGWVTSTAAAQAYACDAQLMPVVTGHVDPAALAAMTSSYLAWPGYPACTCGRCTCRPGTGGAGSPAAQLSPKTLRRLQDTLLKYAADVLSGPAGAASFLRTGLLASEFPPSVSLPLDVGAVTHTVPPHLRRAVKLRDRHCSTPGCRTAAKYCQVHHIKPRSEGGATALPNLVLLCTFHHLICIHRWGWTISLNGDGTTTFTSPDGKRIFRSHGPP